MQIERLLLPGRRWAQSLVLPASSAAASSDVQTHIIVIPGNPGVASFYLTFAERLHASLGGRCSVRALNLAGFVPGQASRTVHQCNGHDHIHEIPAPLYSLADQCEFLTLFLTALHLQLLAADESSEGDAKNPSDPRVPPAKVVRGILSPIIVASAAASAAAASCPPRPPPRRQHRFILVAHSIGSYIALAAMRRAKLDQAAWDKRNGSASSAAVAISDASASAPGAAWSPALAALGSWLVTSPTLSDWSTPLLPRSVPALSISHSFLVAPFVRMDLSWLEFRAIRWMLAQQSWLPGLIAGLLRLLPFALFRVLLRWGGGITMPAAVHACREMFTNSELVRQFAWLGHTEFQFVLPAQAAKAKPGTVFDPAILGEHRERLSMLYAGRGRDIWGPPRQMFEFQALVPQLRATCVPSISHAWCAVSEEVDCVVREVTKQMLEMKMMEQSHGGDVSAAASNSKLIVAAAPAPTQALSNQLIASRL